MRVVAGQLKGRRLVAPPGDITRPTTDKVREAMFNALGSLDVVLDAHVLDLFAGTGALGIEALSRGAEHVTFVENRRQALWALRANVEALDLAGRCRIEEADATRPALLARLGQRSRGPRNGISDRSGLLVFADPPYDFEHWDDVFEALVSLHAPPFLVAESGRQLDPSPPWTVIRCRRYGRTWVAFCTVAF
ncbi:16S rRNA (guanine(966)-N(2))-methyltransferase RsmD [soil metagenome]